MNFRQYAPLSIGLVIVLIGGLFLFMKPKVEEEPLSEEELAATRATWTGMRSDGKFRASDGEFFSKLIESKAMAVGLDESQSEKLAASINNWIRSYELRDYESFRAFRFPSDDITILEENFSVLCRMMRLRMGKSEIASLKGTNVIEAYRLLWAQYSSTNFPSVQRMISGSVDVTATITNRVDQLVVDTAPRTGPQNTPYRMIDVRMSSLVHPIPEELIERDGRVLSVIVTLFATMGDNITRPMTCRLFWDPKTDNWIPWRISTGAAGDPTAPMIF